jgi:hypothetical protein
MIYRNSKDVSPTAGNVTVTEPVKAYYIGGSGNLVVQFSKDAAPRTLYGVQAGSILEGLRLSTIVQAGTTATHIVALW